jgi:hypothetical protein
MSRKSRKNPNIHTIINWRKRMYADDIPMLSAEEFRDQIKDSGLYPKVTSRLAADWDRQARHEYARAGEIATQPVAIYGYLRNPVPVVGELRNSQRVMISDADTRLRHQMEIAEAATNHPDANIIEYTNAAELRIASAIVAKVAERMRS